MQQESPKHKRRRKKIIEIPESIDIPLEHEVYSLASKDYFDKLLMELSIGLPLHSIIESSLVSLYN